MPRTELTWRVGRATGEKEGLVSAQGRPTAGLCILGGVHVPYSLSKLTRGLLLPVIILPDSDPGSVVVKSVFQGHRGMRAEADGPDSGPTLPFY